MLLYMSQCLHFSIHDYRFNNCTIASIYDLIKLAHICHYFFLPVKRYNMRVLVAKLISVILFEPLVDSSTSDSTYYFTPRLHILFYSCTIDVTSMKGPTDMSVS